MTIEWEDDFNEDLLGNPFDLQAAFQAMTFPMSPMSKQGQKNLGLVQRSMELEQSKKKIRRRSLDIFLEQFGDAPDRNKRLSLLEPDEDDIWLKKQCESAKKPRLASSLKSTIFKRQSPTFLRVPQLPASRLVLPTRLKTPAKLAMKRSYNDENIPASAKRLQVNMTPVSAANPAKTPASASNLAKTPAASNSVSKSPSKSRIPVRQHA